MFSEIDLCDVGYTNPHFWGHQQHRYVFWNVTPCSSRDEYQCYVSVMFQRNITTLPFLNPLFIHIVLFFRVSYFSFFLVSLFSFIVVSLLSSHFLKDTCLPRIPISSFCPYALRRVQFSFRADTGSLLTCPPPVPKQFDRFVYAAGECRFSEKLTLFYQTMWSHIPEGGDTHV